MSDTTIVVQEYATQADAMAFANCLGIQPFSGIERGGVVTSAPLKRETNAVRILISQDERRTLLTLYLRSTDGSSVGLDVNGVNMIPVPSGTGNGISLSVNAFPSS